MKITYRKFLLKNHGQIDWTDKCFDNKVTLYIVVPKMHKTKATKLVIRNNIKLNNIIKRFRDDIVQRGPSVLCHQVN